MVVPGRPEPVAAWGDAITVGPTVLHERFGSRALCFEAMAAWVDTVTDRTGGTPLWEGGVQFGDWLDPDATARSAEPHFPGHRGSH
ncbi:hypothetical protein AB0L41_43360 [Amycolatopsis mediterranei]|uniref:alpha-L-rhamnosidase-related protein n=1 Tax=Amycolatopsis mediterranei TaxID=33910 RepID=UPI003426DA0D